MARYAIISHLDSSQRFAIAIETDDGVDTIGISEQGKEWERWADALPEAKRKNIEQILKTLGLHFSVDGPKALTKELKVEFASLAQQKNPSDAKDVEKSVTG